MGMGPQFKLHRQERTVKEYVATFFNTHALLAAYSVPFNGHVCGPELARSTNDYHSGYHSFLLRRLAGPLHDVDVVQPEACFHVECRCRGHQYALPWLELSCVHLLYLGSSGRVLITVALHARPLTHLPPHGRHLPVDKVRVQDG